MPRPPSLPTGWSIEQSMRRSGLNRGGKKKKSETRIKERRKVSVTPATCVLFVATKRMNVVKV